jgi:hypothetical protein
MRKHIACGSYKNYGLRHVKIKVRLSLTKYGEMERYLHAFLTLAVYRDERSGSFPVKGPHCV